MWKRGGFTLIELLIVVAIIGILAAIAVPNFLNAQTRAMISRAQADMKAHETAIGMYAVDFGRQPVGPQEMDSFINSSYQGDRIWQQLTTPIAYLNESASHDPFLGQLFRDLESAPGRFHPLDLYQYRNIEYDRQAGIQGDPDPNASWLTRSAGPDHWSIRWPSRLYKTMAYDPSNGLNSVGDIIHADSGFVGDIGRDIPY